MAKHTNKLPKNRIIYLDTDETTNPASVIHDFFSVSWLPDHLKTLKKWRNDAAFGHNRSKKRNPANLLYDHQLTMKLVEVAWLLKDKKLGKLPIKEGKDDIAEWYIKRERKKLSHYPKNLKLKEMIKPTLVLKRMFKTHKLADYERILNTWLHDALSTNFMEESLSKREVITIYEHLVKLFEAMWLISERSKIGV